MHSVIATHGSRPCYNFAESCTLGFCTPIPDEEQCFHHHHQHHHQHQHRPTPPVGAVTMLSRCVAWSVHVSRWSLMCIPSSRTRPRFEEADLPLASRRTRLTSASRPRLPSRTFVGHDGDDDEAVAEGVKPLGLELASRPRSGAGPAGIR